MVERLKVVGSVLRWLPGLILGRRCCCGEGSGSCIKAKRRIYYKLRIIIITYYSTYYVQRRKVTVNEESKFTGPKYIYTYILKKLYADLV